MGLTFHPDKKIDDCIAPELSNKCDDIVEQLK